MTKYTESDAVKDTGVSESKAEGLSIRETPLFYLTGAVDHEDVITS